MKSDLFEGCNDQRVPPAEFKEMFCKRCRNQDCVNAGWASASFDERMRTQVDRLLINPRQARPEDTQFDPLRAMHFVEVAAAIVLARRADPWAGPGVHLAEPDPATVTSQMVEDAVSKLAEARGRKPTAPTLIGVEVDVAVAVEPELQPPPRVESAPTRPRDSLALPVAKSPTLGVNTDFPDDGVMIGGGPLSPSRSSTSVPDPWAPQPKMNVVPRGAKIKMGE